MCGMCGVGVECEVYAKLEWCVRCMRCVRVWSDVCGECEVGVVCVLCASLEMCVWAMRCWSGVCSAMCRGSDARCGTGTRMIELIRYITIHGDKVPLAISRDFSLFFVIRP